MELPDMTSSTDNYKVQPVKFGLVNIYLVKTENGYILVDAGMPNKHTQLDEVLQKYGVDPKSIGYILLTHGHLDHIGSAAYIKQLTGGKILCHRSLSEDLANGRYEPAVTHSFLGAILNFFSGFLGSGMKGVKPDILVDDEFDLGEFGLSGKVIHTPGHSSSSLSILLDSGEALIGDLVREESPGMVGFGMFYEDKKAILESLKKIAAFNPRIIYLSHGTTIDHRVLNNFMKKYQ